jgi:plastocyanin
MQHTVLNRATIEVADTAEVSGRVTADEVNLDRFHNRIRKVCALIAATLIPSSLRWMLPFTVLIVPRVLWGATSASATPQPTPQTWFATVGAQSNDKGRQALAFLPNEIWIHAGDSITWRWDADDIHTVTFLKEGATRPNFGVPPLSSSPATFDGSTSVNTPPFVKPATFTVIFPSIGNFKQVCLVHERMTGAVHVLDLSQPLPHDQDFYDRQAADQRRDLLSDRDRHLEEACRQHGDQGEHHHSIDAHLVTVGVGEISATAGGAQTLSVVRFIDDTITIHAGQTVEWDNHDPVTPHTVTFGTEPPNPVPPSGSVPISTDADGTLHATISSNADSVNSGLIVAPPQERLFSVQDPLGFTQTRFRVTFMNAGVFPYICALHDNLGMKGTVIVFP